MDALKHLHTEFADDPVQYVKLMEDLELTVGGSFLVDGMVMTRSEIKRRLVICAEWVLILRKDCGWSLPRIADELPKALRSRLDGLDYTPTREGAQSWSSDNARNLVWLPPGE